MAMRKYRPAKSAAAVTHGPEKEPQPPPLEPQDVSAPSDAPILKPVEPITPTESPTPQATPDDDLASLKAQLRTVQFAQKPLEERINELGDLSVAQRAWLRARPQALNHLDILGQADIAAHQNGIERDTPAYFHMLDFVLNALMHQQPFIPQPQVPTAPAPQVTIDADITKEQPMEEDEPNTSHLYSAPISHGTNVTSGGGYEQHPHQVTLSAAEREAARASGVDELEYARNKIKLTRMKSAGLIRD